MYVSLDGVWDRLIGIARSAAQQRRTVLVAGMVAALALTTQAASAAGRQAVDAGERPVDEATLLKPLAAAIAAKYRDNPAGLLDASRASLSADRDQLTIGAYLGLPWATRMAKNIEHYGGMLDSASPAQRSLALAGLEHYSELIHTAFVHQGPPRLIVVSIQGQHLTAFDRGTAIVDTAVTTGRPSLPTDIGRMSVVSMDSPWTMKSPWPKGSPFWYPDTQVRMVVWFTRTGEGMHDADWEPAAAYGAGSQNGPYASHGCIHVPLAAENALYRWATVGTPVVVYPGDGSPVSAQLSQRSVDANGDPIGGVRGD
jgi:lipoprotein-anchoring transpeptidase ErfK/SrfK